MENKDYIKFTNVDLTFNTKTQKIPIFKDLSLEIQTGKFITIIGPSGMGKSTLLNIISGFIKPNSGKVIINGIDLVKMNDIEVCKYRNEMIGYIFQFFNLIPQFNVRDNVAVPLLVKGYKKDYVNQRVTELLDNVGMTNREKEYPTTLSGGEQQRVAFARAIANSPEIILADEPTGNLDSKNGDNLVNMLYDLCHKTGKTILTVTHDMRIIEKSESIINIEEITCTK